MTKDQLRKVYKERRSALSPGQRQKMEDLILIQFQQLDIEIPCSIMTYAPFEKMNEFDPQLITDYCYFKNPRQKLFYPVCGKEDDRMHCMLVNDDTLFEHNRFGIPEPIEGMETVPDELDMIVIPLLAYCVKGHRVGYGKGFYDKFLRQCRDDVIKIGFSFFDPEPFIPEVGRHDVRLDYCVCPERIYSF